MKTLTLCTGNEHKVKEIKAKLQPLGIKVRSALEVLGYLPEVIEDLNTFQGNAEKKAAEFYELIKGPCLADDTGLCVNYLNGAPGVLSARYAGKEHDYKANNLKLLKELEGVPKEKRSASFVTVMVLITDHKTRYTVKGEVHGEILHELKGINGFGYDPLFYVKEKNKTLAEMSMQEKNKLSHRGRAVDSLVKVLNKINFMEN